MKKQRKPRTATNRPLNKWLERNKYNTTAKCEYFDSINDNGHSVTECFYPWSDKCKGNKFNCGKLKFQHLASRKDNTVEPDFTDPEEFHSKVNL